MRDNNMFTKQIVCSIFHRYKLRNATQSSIICKHTVTMNINVSLSLGCNSPAALKTCFLRLPKDGIKLYYEISMDLCAVGA